MTLFVDIGRWVSLLESIELPVMRKTLQNLRALQANPQVSAAEITATVLSDPLMTLRLLRIVNASRGGEFAQRIAVVEHAVMMLGFNATFTRLGEAKTVEDTLSEAVQHGLRMMFARTFHAVAQVRDWSLQRMDINIEEVYVAALLHDLAEMALWIAEPERMESLIKSRRQLGWRKAEQDMFGFPLSELACALAHKLNMPPLVTDAMQAATLESQPRPRMVMLANRLAKDAETGWYHAGMTEDLEDIAAVRRIPAEEAASQAHRVAIEVARRYTQSDATPAAAWLPMLDGLWPSDDPVLDILDLKSEPDVFQLILEELSSISPSTLGELLRLIIRGMCDGIGLRRVAFALLSQDRTKLQPKYVFGAKEDAGLKTFSFDMRERHLFSVLLGKPQAIWLSEVNRKKYAALINDEIERVSGGHEFFAMSLSVHDKMIGLFYADSSGIQPLGEAGYERFKLLCAHAMRNMARLSQRQAVAT